MAMFATKRHEDGREDAPALALAVTLAFVLVIAVAGWMGFMMGRVW